MRSTVFSTLFFWEKSIVDLKKKYWEMYVFPSVDKVCIERAEILSEQLNFYGIFFPINVTGSQNLS